MNETTVDGQAARLFEQAAALHELDRYEEALATALEALKVDPEHYPSHCLVAACLFQLGDVNGTDRAVRTILSMNPSDAWAFRLLSLNLGRMDRRKEAYEAARESVRLVPEDFMSQAMLSLAAVKIKKYDESKAAAHQAIRLAPEDAEGYYRLAQISIAKHRWAKAEGQLRQALKVDPQSYASMNDLGVVMQRQLGKSKQAMDAFQQAAQMKPDSPLARPNLYSGVRKHVYGGGMVAAWIVFMVVSRVLREADPELRRFGVWILAATAAIAVPVGLYVTYQRRRELTATAQLVLEAGPAPKESARRPIPREAFIGLGAAAILAIFFLFRLWLESIGQEAARPLAVGAVFLCVFVALPCYLLYLLIQPIRRRRARRS